MTNGKDFPTCSTAKIATAKSDTVCPKGALVASGSITAMLGTENDQSSTGRHRSVRPALDVWNAGQGKVVYFFVDQGSHFCAGGAVPTGFVGPFPARSRRGKNLVMNIPIPRDVSCPLAGVRRLAHGRAS